MYGPPWPTRSLALKSLLGQNPGILEITVVDPDGNVEAHRHRSNALQIERVDDQPWLNSVMSGGIYVGEISTADYGVPLVNIAVPFRNEEEGIAGSIVARVRPDDLMEPSDCHQSWRLWLWLPG